MRRKPPAPPARRWPTPTPTTLAALNEPQRKALIRFWEAWQEELKGLRILDPACGSGAFLIQTFDQLHAVYESSNARLEELRGQQLTSLDHTIRQGNSIISDPAVHPQALAWPAAFPEVFAQGGFDAVVGN